MPYEAWRQAYKPWLHHAPPEPPPGNYDWCPFCGADCACCDWCGHPPAWALGEKSRPYAPTFGLYKGDWVCSTCVAEDVEDQRDQEAKQHDD